MGYSKLAKYYLATSYVGDPTVLTIGLSGQPIQLEVVPLCVKIYTLFISSCPRQVLHKRYVDATFWVWPHGKDKPDEFVASLSKIPENIKFTMELGKYGCCPFFGYPDYKIMNKSGWHSRQRGIEKIYPCQSVYEQPKPVSSSSKRLVISTLVNRAKKVGDQSHIEEELCFLKTRERAT